MALFADRLGEAREPAVRGEDRSGSRGRPLRGAAAARRVRARGELADQVNDGGRIELLKLLAEHPPYQVTLPARRVCRGPRATRFRSSA